MRMDSNALIQAIEAFAAKRGIAPATVTSRAVSNSRLYSRLKRGGRVWPETAAKVQQWIDAKEAGAA